MNIPAAVFALKKNISLLKGTKKAYKNISRELIEPLLIHLKAQRKEGIEEINSSDALDYVGHEGFFKMDFGSGIKIDCYLDGENAHLFSFSATQKEQLPLMLVSKEKLIEFFDIPKKEASYDVIATHLNELVKDNLLTVKKGEPYLVAKRSKEIDLDLAMENLSMGSEKFVAWESKIKKLTESSMYSDTNSPEKNKALEEIAEGILYKISKQISQESDSPYVSWQKGRESFDPETIKAYIEELEEKHIDIALKITKESAGNEKLVIKQCFRLEEIREMPENIINFLNQEYSRKVDYLSEKENSQDEEIELINLCSHKI